MEFWKRLTILKWTFCWDQFWLILCFRYFSFKILILSPKINRYFRDWRSIDHGIDCRFQSSIAKSILNSACKEHNCACNQFLFTIWLNHVRLMIVGYHLVAEGTQDYWLETLSLREPKLLWHHYTRKTMFVACVSNDLEGIVKFISTQNTSYLTWISTGWLTQLKI